VDVCFPGSVVNVCMRLYLHDQTNEHALYTHCTWTSFNISHPAFFMFYRIIFHVDDVNLQNTFSFFIFKAETNDCS